MGKHQLFRKIPPKDLVLKLLNCFGFKDFTDKRSICKKYFSKMNTIEKINLLVPEIEKYYLPCKSKTYLKSITKNSAMTILRQCIRPYDYVVSAREKYINGEKLINYTLENKSKIKFNPIMYDKDIILTFN